MTRMLPDECIMLMFSFLHDLEDRRSCALVCRRWLQLQAMAIPVGPKSPLELSLAPPGAFAKASAKNPSARAAFSLVSRTLEGDSATDARLLAMAVNLQSTGGMSALCIRGPAQMPAHRQVSNSGLLAMARISPFLKTLTLSNCVNVDDETLSLVARHCPALSKLSLQSCPRLTDRGFLALSSSLQHVSVAACPAVTNGAVQSIAAKCSRLLSLSLIDLPKVNAHCLSPISRHCPKIARLTIAGCCSMFREGSAPPSPSPMPSLRMLTLCRLPFLYPHSFTSVTSAFPSLEALHVTACPGVTDAALLTAVSSFPRLHHLSLQSCAALTAEGVQKLLMTAAELRTCTLERLGACRASAAASETADTASSGSSRLAVAILNIQMALRMGCSSKLTKLRISECDPASAGIWMDTVAALTPGLEWLEVSSISGLDMGCMMRVFTHCGRSITTVDLSACPEIDDVVVAALAQACGRTLETLSIDGCRKVSDRGLVAVLQGCGNIKEVDMASCGLSGEGEAMVAELVGGKKGREVVRGYLQRQQQQQGRQSVGDAVMDGNSGVFGSASGVALRSHANDRSDEDCDNDTHMSGSCAAGGEAGDGRGGRGGEVIATTAVRGGYGCGVAPAGALRGMGATPCLSSSVAFSSCSAAAGGEAGSAAAASKAATAASKTTATAAAASAAVSAVASVRSGFQPYNKRQWEARRGESSQITAALLLPGSGSNEERGGGGGGLGSKQQAAFLQHAAAPALHQRAMDLNMHMRNCGSIVS